MKKIIISLILYAAIHSTHAQLFIANQAQVHVQENGILEVDGNVEVASGGTINMNGQEIMVAGDLMQNGTFSNPNGQLKFTGTGVQNVSGNLSGGNAPCDVVIEQGDNNSSVNLQTNMEVANLLQFVSGKITTNTNEVYVRNTAAGAITGHFTPNITDGTYTSNDRFIEGNLARDVVAGTTYLYPIGNSIDFYNPLQIENLAGSNGKITASFATASLGTISFNGTEDCSQNNPNYSGSAGNINQSTAVNQTLEYTAMTGQGIWEINSVTNYDYDVIAYPNTANTDINPPLSGAYRLLKRPSSDNPATDWTAFALSGNPCVHNENYREVVGAGFSGFSIFGITGPSSLVLPVELVVFRLENIDNNYFQLSWTTQSESNNEGFEIERSMDGIDFQKIGFVQGKGNSNKAQTYAFKDVSALKNITYYYRLKQLDFNGQFEYSDIETGILQGTSEEDFHSQIYPNPTENKAFLNIINKQSYKVSIQLFNISGQLIVEKEHFLEAGKHQIDLGVDQLPPGVYQVIVQNEVSWETYKLEKI